MIVSKLKAKYWERTHIYGIRIPKNIKEAQCLDDESSPKNTFWMNVVLLEMTNVRIAFEENDGNPNELIGQRILGVKQEW